MPETGQVKNIKHKRLVAILNINYRNIYIFLTKTIQEIDQNGIPPDRHSVKWSVKYQDNLYPPKYLISIANRYASGKEGDPSEFSGGDETNNFLKSLGFKVVNRSSKQYEYPVESFSWQALSKTVSVKTIDKSALLHHGKGIPFQMRPFFEFNNCETDNPNLSNPKTIHGKFYAAHNEVLRLFNCLKSSKCSISNVERKRVNDILRSLDYQSDEFIDKISNLFLERTFKTENLEALTLKLPAPKTRETYMNYKAQDFHDKRNELNKILKKNSDD